MTNKTQCPHCLTVYIITDEQFQKSKGKVRCGNCRQPFVVTFLPGTESIEPPRARKRTRTEQGAASKPVEKNRVPQPKQETQANPTGNFSSNPLPDSSSLQATVSSITYRESLQDNLHSELTIDIDDEANRDGSTEDLINEVDALIEEKLGSGSEDDDNGHIQFQDDSEVTLDDVFVLDPRPERSTIQKWLMAPLLVLLVPVLLLLLVYQLWLRQALPILESEDLVERVSPMLDPARQFADEQFDLQIPERRDLANLHLISAQLEPHPVRASTVLLKVSLVNKSNIAQPYPWLELSLLDVDGRLVSRRSLSPLDYLHNNRVANFLRAKELRPITIELLAFPRQAHGFELKVIGR